MSADPGRCSTCALLRRSPHPGGGFVPQCMFVRDTGRSRAEHAAVIAWIEADDRSEAWEGPDPGPCPGHVATVTADHADAPSQPAAALARGARVSPDFTTDTHPADIVRVSYGAAYVLVDGAEWRSLRAVDRAAVEALLVQAHLVSVSGYVTVATARTDRARWWWFWPLGWTPATVAVA